MRPKLAAVLATAVVTALLPLVTALPAAHTVKKVGTYNCVVGWGSEPAYAGLPRLKGSSSSSSGRTYGIIGIIVGALGLVVGGLALVRARV